MKNFQFLCYLFASSLLGVALADVLPTTFDPGRLNQATGKFVGTSPNVRWAIQISSPNYAPPVIANGKVLVGTLNDIPADPRRDGGRSVLLCLDEKDGSLVWQLPLPKDYGISYFDTFCVGVASAPAVAGKHAYIATGRAEVLCIDMNGLHDGNDGPFQDEANLYTFNSKYADSSTFPALSASYGKPSSYSRGITPEKNVLPLSKMDADIIWRYDMFRELGVRPHDTNNCHTIYKDGLLFVNSANATDHTHNIVPNPNAPSLLIFDAEKGIPLARDEFDINGNMSHGQWCSPTLATIGGTDYIFYGGGNGVMYVCEVPPKEKLFADFEKNGKKMLTLKTAWKFQGDPRAQPGSPVPMPPYVTAYGSASYACAAPPHVIADHVGSRVYMLFGHDPWNGARPLRSWLACIDATPPKDKSKTEDRTKTGVIWGTPNIDGGVVAPLVSENGLLYMADRVGNFYCYDIVTGKEHWRLPIKGDVWAQPLIADGKIYVGTDRRMFYVLTAGKEPQMISEITMPGRIFAPAAFSGETLYVIGDGFLHAVTR